jgi:hypothetical protein
MVADHHAEQNFVFREKNRERVDLSLRNNFVRRVHPKYPAVMSFNAQESQWFRAPWRSLEIIQKRL